MQQSWEIPGNNSYIWIMKPNIQTQKNIENLFH